MGKSISKSLVSFGQTIVMFKFPFRDNRNYGYSDSLNQVHSFGTIAQQFSLQGSNNEVGVANKCPRMIQSLRFVYSTE